MTGNHSTSECAGDEGTVDQTEPASETLPPTTEADTTLDDEPDAGLETTETTEVVEVERPE